MTVHEFLQVCRPDAYIGLWNMDVPVNSKYCSAKRFETRPTQQSYFKVGNIPYGRIGRYLDREVLTIDHTEKGFLVRFYDKRRQDERGRNSNLAGEIAKAIKR